LAIRRVSMIGIAGWGERRRYVEAFTKAIAQQGISYSTLTDIGMGFTTRLPGGKGGRIALEHGLRRLGVIQINSPPAGRSHASTRCSRNGSNTHPGATNIDELHAHSTPSSTNTSTAAHTGHCPTKRPPPPTRPHRPRRHLRRPEPARRRPPTPHQHWQSARPNPRAPGPTKKALSPQREPRAIRMSCNITCVAGTGFEPV
jgi:hypothetical protein